MNDISILTIIISLISIGLSLNTIRLRRNRNKAILDKFYNGNKYILNAIATGENSTVFGYNMQSSSENGIILGGKCEIK